MGAVVIISGLRVNWNTWHLSMVEAWLTKEGLVYTESFLWSIYNIIYIYVYLAVVYLNNKKLSNEWLLITKNINKHCLSSLNSKRYYRLLNFPGPHTAKYIHLLGLHTCTLKDVWIVRVNHKEKLNWKIVIRNFR